MQRYNFRPSRGTCIKAVEAGLWLSSTGTMQPIRKLPDGHLVNALLKELSAGREKSATIVKVLGAEVLRRRLREYAMACAAERDGRGR